MKKVMLVFGTRPEAVKMCPLIKELKSRPGVEVLVLVTGQHREMLGPVLRTFGVQADFDLQIMRDEQTLFDVTGDILTRIRSVLDGRAFGCDPDVFFLRSDNIRLSAEHKAELIRTCVETGSVFLTSDNMSTYTHQQAEQYHEVRRAFERRRASGS